MEEDKQNNSETPLGSDMPQGEGQAPKSQEESNQLRQQLESKEQECKTLHDKYLRLYAEFENFKKRAARDQEELTKFGNEQLLKELLPVMDNLERAIPHAKDFKEPAKILEGLELILKQFGEILGKFGISSIESYLHPFDPSIHQAVAQMDSDEHEGGIVIEEIQKGYRINDRILRPSMVVVSKNKAAGGQEGAREGGDTKNDR